MKMKLLSFMAGVLHDDHPSVQFVGRRSVARTVCDAITALILSRHSSMSVTCALNRGPSHVETI